MPQLDVVSAEFASVGGQIQVMPQQGRSVLSTATETELQCVHPPARSLPQTNIVSRE